MTKPVKNDDNTDYMVEEYGNIHVCALNIPKKTWTWTRNKPEIVIPCMVDSADHIGYHSRSIHICYARLLLDFFLSSFYLWLKKNSMATSTESIG